MRNVIDRRDVCLSAGQRVLWSLLRCRQNAARWGFAARVRDQVVGGQSAPARGWCRRAAAIASSVRFGSVDWRRSDDAFRQADC